MAESMEEEPSTSGRQEDRQSLPHVVSKAQDSEADMSVQTRARTKRTSEASFKSEVYDNGHQYIIVRKLGKGAYGTAYVVSEKSSGELFVMKKVRLARQSPSERQASMLEMKLLSQIQHPFIVHYRDSWIESGCVVCIVTSFGERGNLRSWLEGFSGGSTYLEESTLVSMFCQLALALQHLHAHKILHRDIKTENIFVTRLGNLMLGDFGLAVSLKAGDEYCKRMVGTPNYMSPELLSEKPYSYGVDVWALGCVLYEMASLKMAFNAFDLEGLTRKVSDAAPPVLPKQYSQELKALSRWLLTKDKKKRPTVDEVLSNPFLKPYVDAEQSRVVQAEAAMRNTPRPPIADPIEMLRIWQKEQKQRDRERKRQNELDREKQQKGIFVPKPMRPPAPGVSRPRLRKRVSKPEAKATPDAVLPPPESTASAQQPLPTKKARLSSPGEAKCKNAIKTQLPPVHKPPLLSASQDQTTPGERRLCLPLAPYGRSSLKLYATDHTQISVQKGGSDQRSSAEATKAAKLPVLGEKQQSKPNLSSYAVSVVVPVVVRKASPKKANSAAGQVPLILLKQHAVRRLQDLPDFEPPWLKKQGRQKVLQKLYGAR